MWSRHRRRSQNLKVFPNLGMHQSRRNQSARFAGEEEAVVEMVMVQRDRRRTKGDEGMKSLLREI